MMLQKDVSKLVALMSVITTLEALRPGIHGTPEECIIYRNNLR